MEGEESRDILVQLLDNENSGVQGEAVRQLSDQDAEFLGPILVAHLKTAGEGGIYPTNLMDPVMNRIDGGKIEIIKTLGKLKYAPAAKELLPLLETEDEYLFKLVVEVLDIIGSKDYVVHINNHLKKGTKSLIFEISMMIVEHELNQCRHALMEFIATHNRNDHPSHEYTISTCCGLGYFKDQETTDFLISDFQKFMTYKDTIESDNQLEWFNKYIETFATLKAEQARAVIFESIYDWHGLNADFGKYPELFNIKKSLEDSLRLEFSKRLGSKGHTLNYVMAFIANTQEVISGRSPKAEFLIELTIPTNENSREYISFVSQQLNIPSERIFGKSEDGWYYIEKQDRFDDRISSTPLGSFFDYAKALPNQEDLTFLKGVENSGIVTGEYDVDRLRRTIEEIEDQLKN